MTQLTTRPEALAESQRRALVPVIDAMIPAYQQMPSASEVEVHTRWLDEALRLRPDLRPCVDRVLELAAGLPATEALRALAAESPEALDGLGTLVAGAYYMDDRVRLLIGYPGQEAVPVKDDLDTYVDLLEQVVERGPVYREIGEAS